METEDRPVIHIDTPLDIYATPAETLEALIRRVVREELERIAKKLSSPVSGLH